MVLLEPRISPRLDLWHREEAVAKNRPRRGSLDGGRTEDGESCGDSSTYSVEW